MSVSDSFTTSPVLVRGLLPGDIAAVTELNNGAYPAVPMSTEAEMTELVALCDWSVVADANGEVVGFLLAVEPGKDYESENYRFFESRGMPHFYIDRVVLGEHSRGRGLGKRLYRDVFAEAQKRGYQRVTCEVNLKPENPVSLAFHRSLGFDEVAVQDTKGGSVVVQLLEAVVDGGVDDPR